MYPTYNPGFPQATGAYAGMPQYPGYTPIYNPDTQALAPGMTAKLSAINPDDRGLDAFRASALRSGPSPWATAATAKSYGDEALARDTLSKTNASATATANSNLAMRGGLRSGAAERVQTSGANAALTGAQGLAGTGMQNRAQIGINDEQNREAQLGQLPGMEMARAGFDVNKANMGNQVKEQDIQNNMLGAQSYNQFNMDAYKTAGGIWGANQQANATADSASSSWICTEALKRTGAKYTKDERRALAQLASHARARNSATAHFYQFYCRELVHRMVEHGVDWEDVLAFVKSVALQIAAGDLEGAYDRYCEYVNRQMKRHWSDCKHAVFTGKCDMGVTHASF